MKNKGSSVSNKLDMSRLFPSWGWAGGIWIGFWVGILGMHWVLRWLRIRRDFDMDNYWPISIFLPKMPSLIDIVIVLGLVVGWVGFVKVWMARKVGIQEVLVMVLLVWMGMNALQGWQEGFVMREDETRNSSYVHYYEDAVNVDDTLSLLGWYVALQPTLRDHTRVHPPGALLIYYWGSLLFESPAVMNMFIMFLTLGGVYVMYRLLGEFVSEHWALWGAALFGLLPGIQIYSLAAIDAVIMSLFLLSMWTFVKADTVKWFWGCVVITWLGASVTFGSIWLGLSLMGFEWVTRKTIERSIKVGLGVGGLFWLVDWFTGFNYIESLWVAKSFEGPKGFYGQVAPLSYFLTRFEDWLELVVFSGPWVTWMVVQSLRRWRTLPVYGYLGLMGGVAFSVFLLMGAYYTGETGRAAMYIYPCLVLLAVSWAVVRKPGLQEQVVVLSSLVFQGMVMQLFGWYAW